MNYSIRRSLACTWILRRGGRVAAAAILVWAALAGGPRTWAADLFGFPSLIEPTLDDHDVAGVNLF